jgi:hypothetical protein
MEYIPMRTLFLAIAVVIGFFMPARADDVPEKYRPAVQKGLDWLVKQQHKDGHWTAQGGQYPISMTALAGMALLAEGSTARKGKYAEPIRRAVGWLIERSQTDGLIGDPQNPGEGGRYIFGHGYSMAFLAAAQADLPAEQRKKVKDVLNRAVQFAAAARTPRGGWGYVAAKDGGNFDEGACTIAQMQGLLAARAAGIPVPREVMKQAHDYFNKSTTAQGGIIYSLSQGAAVGGERPALTAGALGISADGGNVQLASKWYKYCRNAIPIAPAARFGFDDYTTYYYAQAVYGLGDKGWAKLFPQDQEKDQITWSKYRAVIFDHLMKNQGADGSWTGTQVGPVFTTSLYLIVLQLDKGAVPVQQR